MGEHVKIGGVGATGVLPEWVPAGALHYIAHTENGAPIRVLARAAGCHASTILRQIRKVELRRDDPLVDAALRKLGAVGYATTSGPQNKDTPQMKDLPVDAQIPDEPTLARESMRVLRRLCEKGAVLAVATDLDKAVVVRDAGRGDGTRTAVVDTAVAQAMALKNWIAPGNTGRIIRYHITSEGRSALGAFLDRFGLIPGTAPCPDMPQSPGTTAGRCATAADDDQDGSRSRLAIGESPLAALARRRDKTGKPFLSQSLVRVGERLREDFELAQMDSSMVQNWDHFLTAGTQGGAPSQPDGAIGPAAARARVRSALDHLGPGLADVALRCCCYLEGLETTEKRLGWSARSGKIVLRIALMRLKRHYDETVGPGGPLIG